MAPRAKIQKLNFTTTPETDLFALGLLQLHLRGGGADALFTLYYIYCIILYIICIYVGKYLDRITHLKVQLSMEGEVVPKRSSLAPATAPKSAAILSVHYYSTQVMIIRAIYWK